MKKTTKDMIKAVVVLFTITLVCVGLLAVANEFLKYEPTLDAATAAKLNAVAPSGVDDETAYNDGYFKLFTDDELDKVWTRTDFNKGKQSTISAVYLAVKGDGAGKIIIESVAKGYSNDITMLTAFDSDGSVSGVMAKSQTEDAFSGQIFNDTLFDSFRAYIIGKNSPITSGGIEAATGATTKKSINGLVNAVNVAIEAANELVQLELPVSGVQ